MGESFWADDPDDWNILYINDFVFDATDIEIEGDLGEDWDVQKAPGNDGASETDKGYVPCEPKVTWTLYTAAHQQEYEKLLAAVQPTPGKKTSAVIRVEHPLLRMHKKEKFRIKRIHILKPLPANQMQAQWELVEFFAAPKATPTQPTTSVTDDIGEKALEFRDIETPSKKLLP